MSNILARHGQDLKSSIVSRIPRKLINVLLLEGRGSIQIMRWISVLIVIYYERLTFISTSLRCVPPWSALISSVGGRSSALDHQQSIQSIRSTLKVVRLSILADPQLIDQDSYKGISDLPFGLNRITYLIVKWAADTYSRKSFNAIVRESSRARSDAVIWLGDLLDNGRRPWSSQEDVQRYQRHVNRFQSLFKEKLPTIYIPGNHDIRLPVQDDQQAMKEYYSSLDRWLDTWGTWYDSKSGLATWSIAPRFYKVSKFISNIDSAASSLTQSNQAQQIATKSAYNVSSEGKVIIQPFKGHSNGTLPSGDSWSRTINARIPLHLNASNANPTHELILVNAMDLVGMSPTSTSSPYGDAFSWKESARLRFSSTFNFIESLDSDKLANPPKRILLSHVPLWRHQASTCHDSLSTLDDTIILDRSTHRESLTGIHQGTDWQKTYQNTLTEPITKWLLEKVSPRIIFSGDDHDYCRIKEHGQGSLRSDSPELTLKAFSMTGGVRRPGFARLALTWDSQTVRSGVVATACSLPDQISIWIWAYPVAIAVLLLSLLLDRRYRFGSFIDRIYQRQSSLWRARWIQTDIESQSYANSSIAMNNIRFGRNQSDARASGKSLVDRRLSVFERFVTMIVGHTNRKGNGLSSFESRAKQQLRIAMLHDHKVELTVGALREALCILSLPFAVWFSLQIF